MFEFWIKDTLIGHSNLEQGDPPMGVAHGRFIPAQSFDLFRHNAERLDEDTRRWRGLAVKTANGQEIECHMGIAIIEYGPLDDIFAIEVTCLGIGYPLYEELFPHHVKSYEESFED